MQFKPEYGAFALSYSIWFLFGAAFVLGFGLPYVFVYNIFEINIFSMLFDTMGFFSLIMFATMMFPIVAGLIIMVVAFSVMNSSYKQAVYVISGNEITVPLNSSYEMGPPGNKRYMTIQKGNETFSRRDILRVELTRSFSDKIFNTSSISIYRKSGLFKETSNLFRVTVLSNLKDAEKVLKLLK